MCRRRNLEENDRKRRYYLQVTYLRLFLPIITRDEIRSYFVCPECNRNKSSSSDSDLSTSSNEAESSSHEQQLGQELEVEQVQVQQPVVVERAKSRKQQAPKHKVIAAHFFE